MRNTRAEKFYSNWGERSADGTVTANNSAQTQRGDRHSPFFKPQTLGDAVTPCRGEIACDCDCDERSDLQIEKSSPSKMTKAFYGADDTPCNTSNSCVGANKLFHKKTKAGTERVAVGLILLLAILFISICRTGIVFTNASNNNISAVVGSSAQCMITIESSTNRVLYAKNAHSRGYMASVTKIITAITVLENCADLDKKHKIPKNAVGIEGSSIYLCEGEELSTRDLLYGLMLQSGNDCAVALATITAGSVENFAQKMNETATKAGAKNSNFVNPHGLHDENHYSSAYDLAVITSYAMKNPIFLEITSCKSRKIERTRTDAPTLILNKNKLLSTLDGADGVKTGFTKRAGRCLVASATRDGMQIISVVLNCGPMFEECGSLINRAFKEFTLTKIAGRDEPLAEIPLVEGRRAAVLCGVKEDLYYPLRAGETIKTTIKLFDKYTINGDAQGGAETDERAKNYEKTANAENEGIEIEHVDRGDRKDNPRKKETITDSSSKDLITKNIYDVKPLTASDKDSAIGDYEVSLTEPDMQNTDNESNRDTTKTQITRGENTNFLVAQIKNGTKVGTISFTLDNRLLFERGLFTLEDAPAMPYSDFLRRIIGEW